MKSSLKVLVFAVGLAMAGAGLAADQSPAAGAQAQQQPKATSLDQLLQQVKAQQGAAAAANKAREQRFLSQRAQQEAILNKAKQALADENARTARLQKTFDANEKTLNDLTTTLNTRMGNLGEVFGIVRQVAGDAKSTIDNSLVSAQLPGRSELAAKLAASKALPSIKELNGLWYMLQQEMTEQGKVVKFPTTVTRADGTQVKEDVVRVGVFDAIAGDKFLRYLPETGSLVELARQPSSRFRSAAEDLYEAKKGPVAMAVDPTQGQLLGLLVQAPTFMERLHQGGTPGWTIVVLFFIGLLIVIERIIYLTMVGGKMKKQLQSGKASPDNPLGRVMGVYSENPDIDVETLELKLDEAIMRETPALERFLGAIKLLAAVGPLLGLLGTVIGMIATFQAITLFGTGDPKLMASGISQALVTTVEGLVMSIPLVLLHSYLAGKSKGLIQILEEQSAGIIATQAEKRK